MLRNGEGAGQMQEAFMKTRWQRGMATVFTAWAMAGAAGVARADVEFQYSWKYQINGALAWEVPSTVIPGAQGPSHTFTDAFLTSAPGGANMSSLVAGNADLGTRSFGARAEAVAWTKPWDPNRGSAQLAATQAIAEIRFVDHVWFANPQSGPARELEFVAHPLHLSGQMSVPDIDGLGLGGAHMLVVFSLRKLPLPGELAEVAVPVNIEKILPDGGQTLWDAATVGPQSLTPRMHVLEGRDYEFTMLLRLTMHALSWPFPPEGPPVSSSYARFQQTLGWNGIAGVYDTAGNPVNDVQMFSASGFDWVTPSVVPEPAAWALWLAALAWHGARRLAAARRPPVPPLRLQL